MFLRNVITASLLLLWIASIGCAKTIQSHPTSEHLIPVNKGTSITVPFNGVCVSDYYLLNVLRLKTE